MFPSRLAAKLLIEAPLPEEHDDAFEERLLSYRDRFDGDLLTRAGVVSVALFRRMASLPLTRARANRLVALLIEHHWDYLFIHHSLKEPRRFLVELLEAADPQPPEQLPPLWLFVEDRDLVAGVAAYRRIAGDAAEGPLRAFLRESFDKLEEKADSSRWSFELGTAIRRVIALPELVTDDLRRRLIDRVCQLPVRWLINTYEAYRDALPWLIEGGESTVAAIALERAEQEGESWTLYSGGEIPVDQLPVYLRPAVERRVRAIKGEHEIIGLLRWLEAQGEKLDALMALFVDWLARGEMGYVSVSWLKPILSNRTRWDNYGPPILGALLERGQRGLIVELAEKCIPPEPSTAEEKTRRQHLIAATHEALGRVFLEQAKKALEAADPRKAIPPLHALTALHPRTALIKKVHALRYAPGADGDVLELLELNEQLLKHDTTNEARVLDLQMALSLFQDAAARNREAAA